MSDINILFYSDIFSVKEKKITKKPLLYTLPHIDNSVNITLLVFCDDNSTVITSVNINPLSTLSQVREVIYKNTNLQFTFINNKTQTLIDNTNECNLILYNYVLPYFNQYDISYNKRDRDNNLLMISEYEYGSDDRHVPAKSLLASASIYCCRVWVIQITYNDINSYSLLSPFKDILGRTALLSIFLERAIDNYILVLNIIKESLQKQNNTPFSSIKSQIISIDCNNYNFLHYLGKITYKKEEFNVITNIIRLILENFEPNEFTRFNNQNISPIQVFINTSLELTEKYLKHTNSNTFELLYFHKCLLLQILSSIDLNELKRKNNDGISYKALLFKVFDVHTLIYSNDISILEQWRELKDILLLKYSPNFFFYPILFNSNFTILHIAIISQLSSIFIYLFNHSRSFSTDLHKMLDYYDSEGNTPLHLACKQSNPLYGILCIFELHYTYIDKKDNIYLFRRNLLGETPLHVAIRHRNDELSFHMLSICPQLLEFYDRFQLTPMMLIGRTTCNELPKTKAKSLELVKLLKETEAIPETNCDHISVVKNHLLKLINEEKVDNTQEIKQQITDQRILNESENDDADDDLYPQYYSLEFYNEQNRLEHKEYNDKSPFVTYKEPETIDDKIGLFPEARTYFGDISFLSELLKIDDIPFLDVFLNLKFFIINKFSVEDIFKFLELMKKEDLILALKYAVEHVTFLVDRIAFLYILEETLCRTSKYSQDRALYTNIKQYDSDKILSLLIEKETLSLSVPINNKLKKILDSTLNHSHNLGNLDNCKIMISLLLLNDWPICFMQRKTAFVDMEASFIYKFVLSIENSIKEDNMLILLQPNLYESLIHCTGELFEFFLLFLKRQEMVQQTIFSREFSLPFLYACYGLIHSGKFTILLELLQKIHFFSGSTSSPQRNQDEKLFNNNYIKDFQVWLANYKNFNLEHALKKKEYQYSAIFPENITLRNSLFCEILLHLSPQNIISRNSDNFFCNEDLLIKITELLLTLGDQLFVTCNPHPHIFIHNPNLRFRISTSPTDYKCNDYLYDTHLSHKLITNSLLLLVDKFFSYHKLIQFFLTNSPHNINESCGYQYDSFPLYLSLCHNDVKLFQLLYSHGAILAKNSKTCIPSRQLNPKLIATLLFILNWKKSQFLNFFRKVLHDIGSLQNLMIQIKALEFQYIYKESMKSYSHLISSFKCHDECTQLALSLCLGFNCFDCITSYIRIFNIILETLSTYRDVAFIIGFMKSLLIFLLYNHSQMVNCPTRASMLNEFFEHFLGVFSSFNHPLESMYIINCLNLIANPSSFGMLVEFLVHNLDPSINILEMMPNFAAPFILFRIVTNHTIVMYNYSQLINFINLSRIKDTEDLLFAEFLSKKLIYAQDPFKVIQILGFLSGNPKHFPDKQLHMPFSFLEFVSKYFLSFPSNHFEISLYEFEFLLSHEISISKDLFLYLFECFKLRNLSVGKLQTIMALCLINYRRHELLETFISSQRNDYNFLTNFLEEKDNIESCYMNINPLAYASKINNQKALLTILSFIPLHIDDYFVNDKSNLDDENAAYIFDNTSSSKDPIYYALANGNIDILKILLFSRHDSSHTIAESLSLKYYLAHLSIPCYYRHDVVAEYFFDICFENCFSEQRHCCSLYYFKYSFANGQNIITWVLNSNCHRVLNKMIKYHKHVSNNFSYCPLNLSLRSNPQNELTLLEECILLGNLEVTLAYKDFLASEQGSFFLKFFHAHSNTYSDIISTNSCGFHALMHNEELVQLIHASTDKRLPLIFYLIIFGFPVKSPALKNIISKDLLEYIVKFNHESILQYCFIHSFSLDVDFQFFINLLIHQVRSDIIMLLLLKYSPFPLDEIITFNSKKDHSLLHIILKLDFSQVLLFLISSVKIEVLIHSLRQMDCFDQTPLHYSLQNCSMKCFKILWKFDPHLFDFMKDDSLFGKILENCLKKLQEINK